MARLPASGNSGQGSAVVFSPSWSKCHRCNRRNVEHWWDAAKNFVCVLCPHCDKAKLKRYQEKGAPRRQHIDYIEFRKQYGVCELCGGKMEDHQTCEACGMLLGPHHDHQAKNFRKHQLCQLCIEDWQRLEIIQAHLVSWTRFSSHRTAKEDPPEE